MITRRVLVIIAIASAVAFLSGLAWFGPWGSAADSVAETAQSIPAGSVERPIVASRGPHRAHTNAASAPAGAASTPTPDWSQLPDWDRLIDHLHAEFGSDIEHAYVQMQMIEFLMQYFQKLRPDDWQDAVMAAVRAAFPELEDQLAALLQGRIEYEAWMDQNRPRLQDLDSAAQRETLRATRERLFGAEVAADIWAAEERNQAIGDALVAIDQDQGSDVLDKLNMYRDSLSDIYGEDAERYLARRQHHAMTRFLGLDSVQQALAGLPPEDRRTRLRDIRAGMGLDQAALDRWDSLDSERDQRWAQGGRYMAERAELIARYQDQSDELEREIHALRVRYFGDQAETIRREEQSGLFRFDRERRWGLN